MRGFSRPSLVGAVAKAVGAHVAISTELLVHFVGAGGGDVEKASELYLSVVEEFVELREMARWACARAMMLGLYPACASVLLLSCVRLSVSCLCLVCVLSVTWERPRCWTNRWGRMIPRPFRSR